MNFLAFFLFLFEKFSLLDPDRDPRGKINADCESGSTALLGSQDTGFSYLLLYHPNTVYPQNYR